MSVHKRIATGLLCSFLISPVQAELNPQPLISAERAQAIYRNLLEHHWVPSTGLFLSFPGTQDHKLAQQASTYEQAAVGILAVRLGDIDRAKRIFQFFKSSWHEKPGLWNFYNAEFGGSGIEKITHVGPNAWMGLFAAVLGNRTGSKEASDWALQVARWIAREVPHKDGGVAMGNLFGSDGIPWPKVYSTENNISYYALLCELLRADSLAAADRAWITTERDQVETWLVKFGFDRLAYAMNRGTNPSGMDRTRALDTVTWLISAVGPDRLKARGIDPDRLMSQAAESFEVKVQGLAGVDATDQPEADLTYAIQDDGLASRSRPPRYAEDQRRMIWFEGLAEYINTLNTMADYARRTGQPAKAQRYAQKARYYTENLDRAALKHIPGGAAYPYATHGKFFHDGWYTPLDGAEGPPSSLIAAVWRCFAGLGIDPLAGKDIAGVPKVTVSAPKIVRKAGPRPSILFGTSEDMVVHAWQLMNEGDLNHAIQQAQATVQEWSPWAHQLQEKKTRTIGRLIEYSGDARERKEIFRYWALNDVAAAYYIIGKAFDEQGHYAQATGAFRQIALNYSLAQIWDPRGWFWSPMESIREEFVGRNPRRYSNALPQQVATKLSF